MQKWLKKEKELRGKGIADKQIEETVAFLRQKGLDTVWDVKAAYDASCAMCHATGVAPAAGDKAGWASLLEKGLSKVYKNGLEGTNMGMPAKGGSSLNDDEFKQVVDYMLKF